MAKLEPLKLAVLVEDEKPYYQIESDKVIPAIIARFKEIREGDPPVEVEREGHPNYRANWRRRVRQLDEDALDNALESADGLSDVERQERALVLETARKYFRAVLRAAGATTYGPNNMLRVHWLNENAGQGDSKYKE